MPPSRLLLAALLAAPLPAGAHAILMQSSPPPGGSLPAGEQRLVLRYNSRIDQTRSRLMLIAPDQSPHRLAIAGDAPPDTLATATTLTPGAYTIRWQVLAVDGHITRGDVPFSVTPP